jgi:alginate export protein
VHDVSNTVHRRNSWGWKLHAPLLTATGLIAGGVPQTIAGDSTLPPSPPAFKQLRYDESYAYLRDSSHHADWLDSIKFISLTTNGDWYLTLGGEVQERYEYYHKSAWGRGPQDDNGYLLQRYMIHADAHFGDNLRLFTQFKSGLEDGRNGGGATD